MCVGKGHGQNLRDGDAISIKFKDETKIKYLFSVVDDCTNAASLILNAENIAHAGVESRRVSTEMEAMSKQISVLRQESLEKDSRIVGLLSRCEDASKELLRSRRELERVKLDCEDQKVSVDGLARRVEELEAHSAVYEARCRVLEDNLKTSQEQLEASRSRIAVMCASELQIEDMKIKLDSLQEELVRKTAQLDSWHRLVEEANAVRAIDREHRVAAEEAALKLRHALQSRDCALHAVEVENISLKETVSEMSRKLHVASVSCVTP